MEQKQFIENLKDRKENIEKVSITKKDHLQTRRKMASGLSFASDGVLSQYLELINPSMHLSKVVSKLNKLNDTLKDDRYIIYDDSVDLGYTRDSDGRVITFVEKDGSFVMDMGGEYARINRDIDPHELSDQLVRYCELHRKKPIYAYRHKISGLAYGIVSDRHTVLQDFDVWDIVNNIFENIPHTFQLSDSTFRMTIGIVLDEIAVELAGDNAMKYRMTVGNSMFGIGSAFVSAGSFEKVCSNGAMGWRTKIKKEWAKDGFLGGFDWTKPHIYNPANILKDMSIAITDQVGKSNKYMGLIEEANEVNEPIFKENEDIVKSLQKDRFKLLKSEAENVYRLMKTKAQQYGRYNALDTGRAIAEVARDQSNHDRQIELEQIAGSIMVSQVV